MPLQQNHLDRFTVSQKQGQKYTSATSGCCSVTKQQTMDKKAVFWLLNSDCIKRRNPCKTQSSLDLRVCHDLPQLKMMDVKPMPQAFSLCITVILGVVGILPLCITVILRVVTTAMVKVILYRLRCSSTGSGRKDVTRINFI